MAPPVTGSLDLLDRRRRTGGFLFERWGLGVLGIGAAYRTVIPAGEGQVAGAAHAAAELIAAANVPGALVVGALPFGEDSSATLTVPAHALVNGPRPREVRVGHADAPVAGEEDDDDDDGGVIGPLEWRSEPSVEEYRAAVAEALALIDSGRCLKVVLARAIVAACARPLSVHPLLSRLRAADPGCHLFAVPHDAGTFLGASPETLVRRIGDEVLSFPLAGTAPRAADAAEDRANAEYLLRSVKDRLEHRLVVEAIGDSLGPLCTRFDLEAEPRLIATGAVWHLVSRVRGRLRASAPGALGLAATLHPTPAVCGVPRAEARAAITRLEPAPRGLYAGLVGWEDDRGDGEWALSLRCADIRDREIRLTAGAGIVSGSTPDGELAETVAKLRTMLGVLALESLAS